ncbi:MAG: hypothetical protein V1859_11630 [archaeon]
MALTDLGITLLYCRDEKIVLEDALLALKDNSVDLMGSDIAILLMDTAATGCHIYQGISNQILDDNQSLMWLEFPNKSYKTFVSALAQGKYIEGLNIRLILSRQAFHIQALNDFGIVQDAGGKYLEWRPKEGIEIYLA